MPARVLPVEATSAYHKQSSYFTPRRRSDSSRFLCRGPRDGVYLFRSPAHLRQFLGIDDRLDRCTAYAVYARDAPFCSRVISRPNLGLRQSLLDELVRVPIPSRRAHQLLQHITRYIVCLRSHPDRSAGIFDELCERLWSDLLRTIGLDPRLFEEPAPLLSQDSWLVDLQAARAAQGKPSSNHVLDVEDEDESESEDEDEGSSVSSDDAEDAEVPSPDTSISSVESADPEDSVSSHAPSSSNDAVLVAGSVDTSSRGLSTPSPSVSSASTREFLFGKTWSSSVVVDEYRSSLQAAPRRPRVYRDPPTTRQSPSYAEPRGESSRRALGVLDRNAPVRTPSGRLEQGSSSLVNGAGSESSSETSRMPSRTMVFGGSGAEELAGIGFNFAVRRTDGVSGRVLDNRMPRSARCESEATSSRSCGPDVRGSRAQDSDNRELQSSKDSDQASRTSRVETQDEGRSSSIAWSAIQGSVSIDERDHENSPLVASANVEPDEEDESPQVKNSPRLHVTPSEKESSPSTSPSPAIQLSFRVYTPQLSPRSNLKSILNTISQFSCLQTRGPGYIYAYTTPDHPTLLKIGYTNADIRPRRPHPHPVDHRLAEWSSTCGKPAVEAFRVHIPRAARRVESLIHQTLREHRRVQHPPCERCRGRVRGAMETRRGAHNEWFEIGVEAARRVVELWAMFSRQWPYDDTGQVSRFWARKAERDRVGMRAGDSAREWLLDMPRYIEEMVEHDLIASAVPARRLLCLDDLQVVPVLAFGFYFFYCCPLPFVFGWMAAVSEWPTGTA